jgi:hypothetical protein
MSFELYFYSGAEAGQFRFLVDITAQICGALLPQAHRAHSQFDIMSKPNVGAFEEPRVSNG